ncbi:hypothetical protein NUU61_004909 [Penicillium alfredii]|uniref:Kinetochore protein mis14 n=1 Tax=Penicillium alfredii TaxID=1506179 RepID=A0A9W9F8F8_9EURO|nr:uncharacterized protein NUU61_004909 [Penicillium alfredii]KAJ5095553.1 hypothetical protein NUU61_004909 [Penicillium alfredii]
MAAHYRKIELQSPADLTYLYANTLARSRSKLDLHLPPSATDNETPDPMRERVRELVDEYINQTFTTASSSISINGIDSSSPQFQFPASFTAPETVEYEAYDTELASRVTALYAQLESLTTTVAQLRRDAPHRAAKEHAAQLNQLINEENDEQEQENEAEQDADDDHDLNNNANEAMDESEDGARAEQTAQRNTENTDTENMDVDEGTQHQSESAAKQPKHAPSRRRRNRPDPAWTLQVPLGTEQETERWRSGDMADAYESALRTLLRLQGEDDAEAGADGYALATTVGKAERAGRAAEVVENM